LACAAVAAWPPTGLAGATIKVLDTNLPPGEITYPFVGTGCSSSGYSGWIITLSGGTPYIIEMSGGYVVTYPADCSPYVSPTPTPTVTPTVSISPTPTPTITPTVTPTTPTAYSDWFLPATDTVLAMRNELQQYSVGGFTTGHYWGSYNSSATVAKVILMSAGTNLSSLKADPRKVRACRTFTAGVGAYALRDTGPAGGLIFHISGSTLYYEAAPAGSTVDSVVWSNVSSLVSGTSESIGTGQNNTNLIIAQGGHTTSAAKVCDDLVIYY